MSSLGLGQATAESRAMGPPWGRENLQGQEKPLVMSTWRTWHMGDQSDNHPGGRRVPACGEEDHGWGCGHPGVGAGGPSGAAVWLVDHPWVLEEATRVMVPVSQQEAGHRTHLTTLWHHQAPKDLSEHPLC